MHRADNVIYRNKCKINSKIEKRAFLLLLWPKWGSCLGLQMSPSWTLCTLYFALCTLHSAHCTLQQQSAIEKNDQSAAAVLRRRSALLESAIINLSRTTLLFALCTLLFALCTLYKTFTLCTRSLYFAQYWTFHIRLCTAHWILLLCLRVWSSIWAEHCTSV